MNNEKGFALVTTVFIMISFLSVALLVTYPLVKEVKDHSTACILDRNDYRFKKAIFGELVDQCGTKLAHVRSHYGDYPGWGIHSGVGGGGEKSDRNYEAWMMSRRCFGYGHRVGIVVPEDYRFVDGFWSGYHGKRYVRRLPSDEWGYTAYRPFGRPPYDAEFLNFGITSACGGSPHYHDYNKRELWSEANFSIDPYEYTYVEVRDYSEDRMIHELGLSSTGAIDWKESIYFDLPESPDRSDPDYVRYVFRQEVPGNSKGHKIYRFLGQRKLMIMVMENGRRVMRDTTVLAHPPCIYASDRMDSLQPALKIYRINFYG